MAPASDTTPPAQLTKNPKFKEEWKRHVWRQNTVAQLLTKDRTMIELKSKEKQAPEVYSVHKALLCFYSPYHDRLLNGTFAEGLVPPTEPLIVQANASILELFFMWLYTGRIGISPHHFEESRLYRYYVGVTKLYILADELNCLALQRSIVSAQAEAGKNRLVSLSCIKLLSNSSLETSGLYQYYVETLDKHWDGSLGGRTYGPSSEADDPMPPNLAYRLLMKKMGENADSDQDCACCHDRCKFHVHANEDERKATCGSPDEGLETQDFGCRFVTES